MDINTTENNKRIAKNTLVMYVRMFVCLILSLYSSRLLLQVLGVEDYGINNVVTGFVSMFAVITTSLSGATSRFLSYDLGRNDLNKFQNTFSTALFIQIIIGVVVVIATEIFGMPFISKQMTIPAQRLYAAQWAFQCSVATVIVNFIRTIYNAAIIAHERMGFFAFSNIAEVFLKLLVVLYLNYGGVTYDKLIVYVISWFFITAFIQLVTHIFCVRSFPECKIRFSWDKSLFKELFSYTGWTFIGNMSGVIGGQGVNMVLNIIFGPVVNAARGLAATISQVINNFVNSFTTAIYPQITKSYAAGNRTHVVWLVNIGSRFSVFVTAILTLPLILETPFVLHCWLGEYPEHTVTFVRISLLTCVIEILSSMLSMGQNATGNIKSVQIWSGILSVMNLPISYILLRMGAIPEVVYVIAFCVSVISLLVRLKIFQKYFDFPIKKYVKNVILNICTTLGMPALPIIVLHYFFHGEWFYSVLWIILSAVCMVASILIIGCNGEERSFIIRKITEKLNSFKRV